MEVELEPRVKTLEYKVKAMSRESPAQKAAHVLDSDLRTHWSSGTNTKEWILLELEEPCLLSYIRIYNKSVLEWEISAGLRYKPETFVKVRPRCEAPRRDVIYPMNYSPCRYVRVSCLRGNPIAIFFIQLIGVSVAGLEPEFQPVVNHLLPEIISHKQDAFDMHLQLLKDMTSRLLPFLPQLEADFAGFSDAADLNLRFLAMLAGPFYPILHLVNERATSKTSGNVSDTELSKSSQQLSALTVSSNFEPRRSRSTSPFVLATSSSMIFRPDSVIMLLRKACKDSDLGAICRMASRILQKLIEPLTVEEASTSAGEATSTSDEMLNSNLSNPVSQFDYSKLFGEDFRMPADQWDSSYLNILDIVAVEEGVLHVLYACASQPILCSKLAERTSDFWSALPLVQALLPALRPSLSSPFDVVNDSFSQWKQPLVQQALSQIVATSSSLLYHPLLHACAGYLSSFSQSHAKAACLLIDLCSSVLAPWMPQVVAKIDLAIELLEDLLGVIQGGSHSMAQARAALKYMLLALSGHIDDILGKYKEVKHRILFLVEMLEPFLDPAIGVLKTTIAFGDLSSAFPKNPEQACLIALGVIRTAVQKSAVLPSLESEWRRGLVAPSVLLSILEPHMQLPPEIDLRKPSTSKTPDIESARHGGASLKLNVQDDNSGKTDDNDTAGKMDVFEDAALLFVPAELRNIALSNISTNLNNGSSVPSNVDVNSETKEVAQKSISKQFPTDLVLDTGISAEHFNLQADYFQLVSYQDCDQRASEFRRLALDLHSQNEITVEGHDAAIDALLLSAECYVNPLYICRGSPNQMNKINTCEARTPEDQPTSEMRRLYGITNSDLETIAHLEKRRDKIVLQTLLEAAELDRKYHNEVSNLKNCPYNFEESDEQIIKLSPRDMQYADAVTLVRQNQALLCDFVIRRLQKEQNSIHEILLQSLVFLLHSATKIYCTPEDVIDIIIGFAEFLNGMLTSLYYQLKEGRLPLEPEKIHGIQRRWILLQKLILASSGGDEGTYFAISPNNGIQYGNLIPASAWMQRIHKFSTSQSPVVRFLCWMAVSRNAKQYIKDRLFLASDLSQLTCLLHIFSDELSVIDRIVNRKNEELNVEGLCKHNPLVDKEFELTEQLEDNLLCVIYPDISKFFPNMKKQFQAFGEVILEAVGLQLKSLSSSVLPDILCWFSDLCSLPFRNQTSRQSSDYLKGYASKNAKAMILYILEAIVSEHMEAMVPEIPRLVQVLVSLCRTSYCDVSFLKSVLLLMKPIISYSLHKVSDEERLLVDDSCLNFESLCFDELFNNIKPSDENEDSSTDTLHNRALMIFILASIFPDLSFPRKKEMLQSLISWVNFASYEPTSSFFDYLCSFQTLLESCKEVLFQTLRVFGAIPLCPPSSSGVSIGAIHEKSSEAHLCFLNSIWGSTCPGNNSQELEHNIADDDVKNQRFSVLSAEEIEEFSKDLVGLIDKLNPSIELCWNLHNLLAKKLTVTAAECFVYSRCLYSKIQKSHRDEEEEAANPLPSNTVENFQVHWRTGLEGLAETIIILEQNSCWKVAFVMLDCLLGLPLYIQIDNVIGTICSAVKNASCCAPKVTWRLQSHKWLSVLLDRGISTLHGSEAPLVDLFCMMLGHPEPEQRYIALQQLRKLVGQEFHEESDIQSSKLHNSFMPTAFLEHIVPDPILSHLVSCTWDQVAALAASDTFLFLRTRAMALLIDYVPFVGQNQLRSFLVAADSIPCMARLSHPTCEGPLLQLSLALIASACLHSPAEDISLIPDNIWRNIEILGSSKTDSKLGDLERKACQVLCRLRNEGDEVKEVLKEVLSSSSSKQFDPDFKSTRESVLQVLSNITSAQSFYDMFSRRKEQEAMELEEAEIELDIAQNEHRLPESSKNSQIPFLTASAKDESRLQQIKDCILTLEKSKLREDVVTRRQKKLLMRRERQKKLEEAALREAELLQELDRERTTEVEKEIERQRLLELERAKTRELRHNLDIEKERQTQRELQRELEQAESGVRLSRRDFSSTTHNSRPRDRYRERENGRSNEGNTRTGSSGLQLETSSTNSSMPAVILSGGSRQYSGQPPTILQSRDRPDEGGSGYEENIDGSRDSGDTGSAGDPDLVSVFDGQSGFGSSSQRHVSSRGSKSRQVVERRERDSSRREGKWERKHS